MVGDLPGTETGRRLLALLVVCTVALAAVPGLAAADTPAGRSVVGGENETIPEALAVGGLLVGVLDIVPVLGGVAPFVVLLLGLGALVRLLSRRFRRRRRGPAETDAADPAESDETAGTDAAPSE